MNYDLKIIKNKYGEKLMHLCRELFPTLLEEEGLLSKLLLDSFYPSRDLYDDIIESKNKESFKNYIYSLIDAEEESIKTPLTPVELLKSVGYNLYECKTEADIQSFRRYYKKGEELCTFTQGDRLNRCHVFFAVKENVDEIKREDFKNPNREDSYGTSVISIQFTKGKVNTLSIKNRYNHTVENPDNTYFNNLENIVPGLTDSFEVEYKLNINQNDEEFELPGYVKARDGKYYKYNYERNNIYYCPNNIIIDNFEVKKLEEEKYIVLDYFVLNLVDKEITLYDNQLSDSFIGGIINIDKISIEKDKETGNKKIEIKTKENNLIIIEIDKQNNIIAYENKELTSVEDNFLFYNKKLRKLNTPNIISIKHNFLICNNSLLELNLPILKEVGYNFLQINKVINKLNLPSLKKVGSYFLYYNTDIEEINMPSLESVGDFFLENNERTTFLNLPNLKYAGSCFMRHNTAINEINMPNLTSVSSFFLNNNKRITKLNLPNLKWTGPGFMSLNEDIEEINLPSLKEVEEDFLCENKKTCKLDLPNLRKVGSFFMGSNEEIEEVNLPSLELACKGFLQCNKRIIKLTLSNLKKTGSCFMEYNKGLVVANLPSLEEVGPAFLVNNTELIIANFPKLREVGRNFLINNTNIDRYELLKKCKIEIYDIKDLFDVSIIKIKKVNEFIKRIIRKMINKILKKEQLEIKVK